MKPEQLTKAVRFTQRHVILKLTRRQAKALQDLCAAANMDGDHEQWLRSAGATASDIRALRDCMDLVGEITCPVKRILPDPDDEAARIIRAVEAADRWASHQMIELNARGADRPSNPEYRALLALRRILTPALR